MRKLADIRARTPKSEMYRGQIQHFMLLILLSYGAVAMLGADSSHFLVKIAIALAILHQVLVAFVFRTQLHMNLLVKYFGDNALKLWGTVFLPLLVARPIMVVLVGLFDFGSMSGSMAVNMLIGIALIAPAAWTMHTVLTHFTIYRALGGDHFSDEYLNMPMVTEGAFKYFPNAMYTVVFTGFWGIAFVFSSWNALVLALFYHAYIWVHMYCTEEPDMRILYADSPVADPVEDAEIIPDEEPTDDEA